MIYQRYHVTLIGSVPVQDSAGSSAIEFRIEGKITKAMLHSKTRPYLPDHSLASRSGLGVYITEAALTKLS